MPELNPFENLDLTRYGFGPERRLAPMPFPGLGSLTPQPVENPATAVGAPPAGPGAGPYGAGGAPGGLNPFDFAGPNKGSTVGGYENTGPGSSQTTLSEYAKTGPGKAAMAFLSMIIPGFSLAAPGARDLLDRITGGGKEEQQAYTQDEEKRGLTQTRELMQALITLQQTQQRAQALAQTPLDKVQQTRPVVPPSAPAPGYDGPDYGGFDGSSYDLSSTDFGLNPF